VVEYQAIEQRVVEYNGYRANGGQTSGTNAYIVGERGRELFIPSTDGQIVSNENLKSYGWC
jgi:hypothetical protein